MKRTIISFFLSVVFFSMLINVAYARVDSEQVKINYISIGEYGIVPKWEDEILVRVSVSNLNDDELENVKVKVFIEELGIYEGANSFDLDECCTGNRKTSWLVIPLIGKIPAGEYLVKIVVENDKFHKTRYRYLRVFR